MEFKEPHKLKQDAMKITYFIALYENYKSYIINYLDDFFMDVKIEDGVVIETKHPEKISEIYDNSNKKITKTHLGKINKYLTVYLEWEILNITEIEIIRLVTYIRNELTHNLLLYLMGEKLLVPEDIQIYNILKKTLELEEEITIKQYITLLTNIFTKTSNNLFKLIDNTLTDNPINMENVSDDVMDVSMISLHYIDSALFNQERAEAMYKEYKKQEN